jgi:hypothetical protein
VGAADAEVVSDAESDGSGALVSVELQAAKLRGRAKAAAREAACRRRFEVVNMRTPGVEEWGLTCPGRIEPSRLGVRT